jgi:hypothetical protein
MVYVDIFINARQEAVPENIQPMDQADDYYGEEQFEEAA